MGLTEDFIARYRKEYDFYDQVARLVAQSLEVGLQGAGIRSMVTSRAKSVIRLESKINQRAKSKRYSTVEDIYSDIPDLAGARVALYFPAERTQVDTLIKSLFSLTVPPKTFPDGTQPPYQKRFSGYSATHYRVQLRDASLSDAQKRYAEGRVEIQVASVLMHAWAEVEHDLVYKPLQGALSEEEYAILDELNGVVMAGEIALERLQRAGETRVAAAGRKFSNHFDLAAYLINSAGAVLKSPLGDTALGRVDILFDLLAKFDMASPERLAPYIAALHGDIERRPISEQIVDQMLAEDESRYRVYETARLYRQATTEEPVPIETAGVNEAIGKFLAEWIKLEKLFRQNISHTSDARRLGIVPTASALERFGLLDPNKRDEFERLRRLRNNLVHGIGATDTEDIANAVLRLREINAAVRAAAPKRQMTPTNIRY